MNKMRNLVAVILPCLAGYLGGVVSIQERVKASSVEVIRAREIELVDDSGAAVARMSTRAKRVVLSFFDGGRPALELGIVESGRPFLSMFGRDGKNRMDISLGQEDKASLIMSDELWGWRVSLGFKAADTYPAPNWDRWGLSFRGIGMDGALVGMGMQGTFAPESTRPFITMNGKRIR